MSLSTVFFFAALACMVAVLASLVLGIFAMTQSDRGENGEQKAENAPAVDPARLKSNKMMQMRVIFQGLALLFLVLAALAK